MRKILLGACLFVVVYNILFFQTSWGVGSGLLFLFLNLFYFSVKDKIAKNLALGVISSVLSTLFGFLLGYRSNEILGFANFMLASLFSLTAFYLYKSELRFSYEIPDLFLTPIKVGIGTIRGLGSIFNFRTTVRSEENDGLSASIIKGLVITLPVSAILLVLLTQADPIFNKLVQNFFGNLWQRIFVSLLIFIGLLSFGLAKIQEVLRTKTESQSEEKHKVYELLIISGSLVTLFGLFILVQFRYFFAGNVGERDLIALGINSLTYSDYVRKGFFELLAASAIASLIILYITKFIHKLKGTQKFITQIVSVILTSEIGLLLFSALQRLNLYQQAHGLTRARVFGFVLLVWLAAMLVIFLIRVFQEIAKEWLFHAVVLSTLILVLALNIVNIDGVIATQYVPTVNKEIDYYYLVGLSPDASASWVVAIQDSQRVITSLETVKNYNAENYRQLYWARTTLDRLDTQVNYLTNKYGDESKLKFDNDQEKLDTEIARKWQSWNLGEQDAYKVISNNPEVFSNLKGLIDKANAIDAQMSIDIKESTVLDRDTQPPLL